MRGRFEHQTWQHDPTLDAPARYRRACAYDAFVPDPIADLGFELPGDVAGVVSEAETAIAALNADATPELRPLARLLLRTESIASSKVEGLQVGTKELARAEANEALGRRIGPESAEIIANIDAMEFAIEEAAGAAAITRGTVQGVHRVLMRRSPTPSIAGLVRDRQNWIGGNDYNPCGAAYVPPPPRYVEALMDDLLRAIDDDTLPPVVHAALIHAQFETIHPFIDGNGRTGRALIHVVLRRRGLAERFVPPISTVFAKRKESYLRGLTAFREDDLSGWVESFAGACLRSAKLASRYIERVRSLQGGWRERLETTVNPRADAAAWSIIQILPAHPVITVPVGVTATHRTKPAVTNAIDQLVGAGVLVPLGSSQRNRAWEGIGLLDLIHDLEAGDP